MDSELLVMFKNGNYQDVIDKTSKTNDIDELFLRAISFALSNDYTNGIKTITDNESILNKNLAKLIDVHMQICFWYNKLVDASNALNHYQDYPYISQEVEEKFIFYKKEIDKKINELGKADFDDDDLLKMLNSGNEEKILSAVNILKTHNIEGFLASLQAILIDSNLELSTRCLTLILLLEKKYNKKVKYLWHSDIVEVVPCDLITPFQDQKFNQVMKKRSELKDVAYAQTFETLLATFYLYRFPYTVKDEANDIFAACDIVTRRCIGWPENKMRQKPNVEALIKEIEDANSAF